MSQALYVFIFVLCYQSETALESGIFSYKSYPHGHRYFVKELLCIHTLNFIVHMELKLLGRWLPEAFSQLVKCFKYADNGPPAIDSLKSDPG